MFTGQQSVAYEKLWIRKQARSGLFVGLLYVCLRYSAYRMEERLKPLIFLCLLFTCISLAWADGKVNTLDIKPGYWQFSISPKLSGAPTLSASDLAKMTPEQRTIIETEIKAMEANKPGPVVYNDCITAQELKQGNYAISATDEEWQCTSNSMTSQDGKHFGADEKCTSNKTGEEINGSGSLEVHDREHFDGSGKIQGSTLLNNFTFSAKWVQAACPTGGKK